ncbi:PREDICTED: selenocysteine-specific elongation factor [Nicrophorus vespilloides]|uniref:Selenocysteine-specific elongation factor n=1 Tax=Nicrophorus vespilloides TaxID=110193 RepID=A0ABM1M6W7_NICVS|nr:PREDICTED: selenocysteine-specific elongation factor [Nicrophorus vespilloides]
MPMNLNIGILGHIDSGKTSLAKCLSEIASTASFDKSSQSQARGITLDLGFSSFTLPAPDHLCNDIKEIQYTLVDCPGHASLIKTILGGAQIIDMMILVIDVTKGIQTQTAECIIIGEITCKKLILVLNKIDLLDLEERSKNINKVKTKMLQVLNNTSFGNENIPVIGVSATQKLGIDELKECISKFTYLPNRSKNDKLLFSFDHCFNIKGQGTVLTGTIIQGSVKINDEINIPELGASKKVKSMQVFRKPVSEAMQGDRVGICINQLDAKLLERGYACTPGFGKLINFGIIKLNAIKYFKETIKTKSKYNITIGHETIPAEITLFSCDQDNEVYDLKNEYLFEETYDIDETNKRNYFALLQFDKPFFSVPYAIMIGTKLDTSSKCRIAYWGRLLDSWSDKSVLNEMRVYKTCCKHGAVDRIVNENAVIIKNMFHKNSDMQKFCNFNVELSNGAIGYIEGSFGKSGKVKVCFKESINIDDSKGKAMEVTLKFKKYIFDVNKTILTSTSAHDMEDIIPEENNEHRETPTTISWDRWGTLCKTTFRRQMSCISKRLNPPRLSNKYTLWEYFRKCLDQTIIRNMNLKSKEELEEAVEKLITSTQNAAWSTPATGTNNLKHGCPANIRRAVTEKRKLIK